MRVFIFLFFIPFALFAEISWKSAEPKPFEIKITIDKSQANAGETIKFEADFIYPSNYKLDVDAILSNLTWSANPMNPLLHVYQYQISNEPHQEGISKQHLAVEMTSLQNGQVDITAQEIVFHPIEKEKPPISIATPVFIVEILPAVTTENSLSVPYAPLAPIEMQFPMNLSAENRQYFMDGAQRLAKEKRHIQMTLERHTFPWFSLMLLLGCAAVAWGVYLMRSLLPERKKAAVIPPATKEQIISKLANVHEEDLSPLLQKIIRERLNIKAEHLTSDELSDVLKQQNQVSSAIKNNILELFRDMDRIKFAGIKPSSESTKQMSQKLKNIIDELYASTSNSSNNVIA